VLANEEILAKIKSTMRLRQPQEGALDNFFDVIGDTDRTLAEITQKELVTMFKIKYPNWHCEDDRVEFTYHLATGVGKTRLIGATMAYLCLTGMTRNFLIISPRTEIIKKFL